ncbi:MAG TPA: BREX system ATP-binding domain-containing protein, partial [Chitinophagaceae bacterium]|nr:BREX system ATP-binding domain-containing protein [Chitinophagaceae bacterium]
LVRHELGISDREHFILMHDASILNLWDIDQEYYQVRNHLLSHGILLTYENKYVIADEVAVQIRKAFGIEMKDGPFLRLLSSLTNEDLATALTYNQLTASGTKDVKVERLLHSLIPPSDILDLFNLEVLRELCRRKNIQHLGTKGVIIDNIIGFFDGDKDLQVNQIEEPATPSLPEPEVREMDPELYSKLLMNLTVQQLYDILSNGSFMTSGSKEDKVKRILSTYWSERTVFNQLRKEDLSQLCRKFALPVSGSKQELVDRILEYIPSAPVSDLHVASGIDPIKDLSPRKESDQLHGNVRPSAELPEHYNEINAILPNLDHNEKIILAILKSSKSLNEVDLQRVAIKYGISWFLFKAHMALIMDKLKQANKTYIQIKSAQDNNIYQWDANGDRDNHMLEKKSARDIIDALRHGVVPRNNLDLVAVGQQAARSHLSEILMEINPHKSHFKFIRGPYGSGKTFLCSWLKNFALNHDFAVSLMNISHDQPLSDLPVFFAGMVNGLRTPEKTNASALVDILESWLLNIRNKLERIDGLNPDKAQDQQELNRIVKKSIEIELANLNDIEPGFPQALRSFYEGKVSGNTELVTEAVSWITGSKALSFQALKDIGVKGYLEANNVFPRMRALLKIIMGSGYRGLLLLVDELELVRRFPHARQREQALETLRLLIDESGRNALPGSLIIFTGTDEFFEDERNGLKSYEALSERVMTPVTQEDFVSMRQPIISLESLDRERLAKVILKVRELYGIAYNCDACQFADDDS